MSFVDNAVELLDRTEASLNSLIAEALRAKAYDEIVAIAGLARSVAAIGRNGGPTRGAVSAPPIGISPTTAMPDAPAAKSAEPSWMRPKTS
jgi:hypothetical protein